MAASFVNRICSALPSEFGCESPADSRPVLADLIARHHPLGSACQFLTPVGLHSCWVFRRRGVKTGQQVNSESRSLGVRKCQSLVQEIVNLDSHVLTILALRACSQRSAEGQLLRDPETSNPEPAHTRCASRSLCWGTLGRIFWYQVTGV